MKICRIFFLVWILLEACIEPLPVDSASTESRLVVDGMITDQPGSNTVRLFWSTVPFESGTTPRMVTGALVSIKDDADSIFTLRESEPGVYESDPSELQGRTGKSYSLIIEMDDGSMYQSTPEALLPAGDVDSVYARFVESAINPTDPALPQDAMNFYVDARSDRGNPRGFQRWRSRAIYEIFTYPELRTKMRDNIRVPDPLPCSGYISVNDELRAVDTCSCCTCWVYEYPRNAVVSPARFAEGNEFRSVALARVPVDSWRFFRKYYFEVEQLSVSENVYEFWKRVGAQQQGTGSLFQPNAVKIQGNIRCVSDPKKEVFGIFSASSITRKSIFINRQMVPRPVPEPDRVTFDCRYSLPNSENVRPPFW